MAKFKCYAGGKMSGLTFDGMNSWRLDAKRLFNECDSSVVVVNPVDFYNFKMDKSTYNEREVMEFDLYQVADSDLLLINLDHPNSIGTAIEMFYAYFVLKIPVVAFGTAVNHPWIENCVNKKCKDLYEAVQYIQDFYLAVHR